MLSSQGKQLEAAEDGTLTRMGKFYNAILNFSVITRYFIYVSPLALLIAIPIIVGATVAQTAEIGGVRIVWFFTWVEIVWLSLWVSKIVAHYIPFVFQFLCGIISSGTRKYALLLKALEIPLSLIGWSVTSLATFIPVCLRLVDLIIVWGRDKSMDNILTVTADDTKPQHTSYRQHRNPALAKCGQEYSVCRIYLDFDSSC